MWTIILFILIAFIVIYPIATSLWHLRKLRLAREGMNRAKAERRIRDEANSYQRYLYSHNAWINRMYHEMFNEQGDERTLDAFKRP